MKLLILVLVFLYCIIVILEFDGIFNTRNLFVGGNTRKAVNSGQNDYVRILYVLMKCRFPSSLVKFLI